MYTSQKPKPRPPPEDKIVVTSDNLFDKTELLHQMESTDVNNKDHMDRLIKNMMTKLRKGAISVEIRMTDQKQRMTRQQESSAY